MKKLVLAVSLFIAFTANAQQRNNDTRNNQTEFHQSQKNLDGLKLTSYQKKQINAISKERLSQREYEARLKKILNKEQYSKYLQYQKNNSNKDKKVAENHSFRK